MRRCHPLFTPLSLVESARSFLRVRSRGAHHEGWIADAERSVRSLWNHCEIWELTREVCDLAEIVAPTTLLRSLDALHLATALVARSAVPGLRLLSLDQRIRENGERLGFMVIP